MAAPRKRSRLRRCLGLLFKLGAVLLLALLLALLFWLRGALYHRWVLFPRQERALAALAADRQPVTRSTRWTEFSGVIHSHSALSHDCEVPFPEILEVLKETGRDFICLTDHATDGRADFDAQWRGLHEGKLFIPGFELKHGFMPIGVRSGVLLSNTTAPDHLAREIVGHGGLLFYAHPEEPRDWSLPELTGMEIYNIHADFKDERRPLVNLVPDILVNLSRHPDLVLRQIFDRPFANLERWDTLNRERRIVGIAGNDCHQNTGLRLLYTEPDTLRLEDTSPETLREWRLNALTRRLARLCLGPLDPGRPLVRLQLDPYARMVRFVGTHVLARELTEPAILSALQAGRVFVGFDSLADSSGFLWLAENPQGQAVMGGQIAFSPDTRLKAFAPQACRFTVIQDGTPVHRTEGRSLDWTPSAPGQYRVEAELKIADRWTPWIYANPIRVGANAEPDHQGRQFFGWDAFDTFIRATNPVSSAVTLLSPPVTTAFAWDELVASWNAAAPTGGGWQIEARALRTGDPTRDYTLGLWSLGSTPPPRQSVPGQADADGEVQTDTLVLRAPANGFQLRVTAHGTARPEDLHFLGASVVDTHLVVQPRPPFRPAWGRVLDVPRRSQLSYPGGDAWCSPTATSMLLAFWAGQLDRPDLDREVPEVAAGVDDPNWPGTGNWPFNTAYVGSLPGLRAYVTRLSGLPELEAWIAAGIPVATSIDYAVLKGSAKTGEGHLVLCVGFTDAGDVVLNDPGKRIEVRRTVPRDLFARAWERSRNTVYLVHPVGVRLPPNPGPHWFTADD